MIRLENVLKTSWRCPEDVLKTSWRCLEDVLKTFWKRLEDVLNTSLKRLDDVLRRFEDVLKRFWKSLEDFLNMTSKRLEDVLKTWRVYWSWSRRIENVLWRHMNKENIFVLMKTPWRRLEDIFWRRRPKWSSRHLQDIFIKTNVCWASTGYLQRVIYNRFNEGNDTRCSFIMSKSRLAFVKKKTLTLS